jgi:membrane protein YqaA with SNARE-associated domain
MKTSKFRKLIVAGLIGCAICCLPLLLPLAAGFMGISILGFSVGSVLCGVLFIFLALALFGVYLTKRKKVCVAPSHE